VSLPGSYFDDMYAAADDPWGFEARWYERRKYALTLSALPKERYRRGFEPGCSIGVLSGMLAERCDALLASDVAAAAVEQARRRLADRDGVDVAQLSMPADWPDGDFDLIVLSEMAYYFSRGDLAELLRRAAGSLTGDGTLLACHWRHPVADYPLSGDEVHAAIAELPGLERTVRHVEADLVLEVYQPAPARSVAQTTGLV
jgi:SAM-dependent methyltransferase